MPSRQPYDASTPDRTHFGSDIPLARLDAVLSDQSLGPSLHRWKYFSSRCVETFRNNTGLLLIAASQAFGATMSLFVKKLNSLDPPVPTLEVRGVKVYCWYTKAITWACCVTYMVLSKVPDPILGPKEVRLLLAFRGVCGFMGLFGSYYSLQYLSLSDATVLQFLAPMCTAVVGALVLKEEFKRSQAVASYTSIRAIGKRAHPLHSVVAFSTHMLIVRPHLIVPTRLDWIGMLFAIGLLGFGGQVVYFVVQSITERETAGRGTMGTYIQIIFATFNDLVFFHAPPSVLSIIGTVIIMSSAIYVAVTKGVAKDKVGMHKRNRSMMPPEEDPSLEEGLLASDEQEQDPPAAASTNGDVSVYPEEGAVDHNEKSNDGNESTANNLVHLQLSTDSQTGTFTACKRTVKKAPSKNTGYHGFHDMLLDHGDYCIGWLYVVPSFAAVAFTEESTDSKPARGNAGLASFKDKVIVFLLRRFGVRQDNVFDFIAPSFLISFVPIVLIFPIARLWATADWGIQYVQPYIMLANGNARAEDSVLLDYMPLKPLLCVCGLGGTQSQGSVAFTPTVADEQFGVSQVDATSCGLSNQTDTGLLPVFFWFYNVRLGDQGQSTPEAKAVICRPSIALRNVQAKLNMSSMSIDTIVDLGAFSATNNVTSGSLEGKAYNGVIFSNISSAILKARATSIQIGLLGSIYRSASQTTELLDSLFSSEDGFLNLTQQIYTQFLAVAAKSVYLIQIQEEEPITAYATAQVQRLVIDTLAAHFLAMGLLTVGVVGAIIHYLHLPYRRRLHLTAPPGSIATSVALAFHSGFGDRLRPYDDDKSMMRKLSNFRFVTDTRTGAIIAEELNHDEDSMELGPLDQDKDTVALLHDERSEEHYDEH
ncbi:predicted protein [Postia placenta Mad-698-R]|nr:predicted protein [Postia placenta Mad-698-R]